MTEESVEVRLARQEEWRKAHEQAHQSNGMKVIDRLEARLNDIDKTMSGRLNRLYLWVGGLMITVASVAVGYALSASGG